MKNRKNIIINLLSIITISCLMTSCYPTKQVSVLNSWVGGTKSNLYRSWGAPDRVTDDGNGGEIATYTKSFQSGGMAYTNNGITTYTAPETKSSVYMFYSSKDGMIYQWKYFRYGKEIMNKE